MIRFIDQLASSGTLVHGQDSNGMRHAEIIDDLGQTVSSITCKTDSEIAKWLKDHHERII